VNDPGVRGPGSPYRFLFPLLFAFAAVPAAGGVLPEARPILTRLERAIGPLTSLEARFVQVRHVAITDEDVEAAGRLRFLAPGSFRLDYKTPDPDVLTLRGDTLMVYFASLEQLQLYPLDEEESARDMFLLFSSRPGDLEKKFDISLGAPSPFGRPLKFQPLSRDLDESILEIQVDLNDRTSLPERIFFREPGGDTVLFRLQEMKTDRRLSAGDFRFDPPRGTEIIQR
jgi:outer membrane lipoprotein-sorting protein